ncbi:MAG: hypothetical protein ACK5L3_11840 [Oscillospiraceae bacterium]
MTLKSKRKYKSSFVAKEQIKPSKLPKPLAVPLFQMRRRKKIRMSQGTVLCFFCGLAQKLRCPASTPNRMQQTAGPYLIGKQAAIAAGGRNILALGGRGPSQHPRAFWFFWAQKNNTNI